MKKKTQELLDDPQVQLLRGARTFLENYGVVGDQSSGEEQAWCADTINPIMTDRILDLADNQERTEDGYPKYNVVCASRQSSKTWLCEAVSYARCAYKKNQYHATIADTKERVTTIFDYIQVIHAGVPKRVQMPTVPAKETKQLTFDHGGRMRTLAAGMDNLGIGRAADFIHLSEVPFQPGFAELWEGLVPALNNRKNSLVFLESTPAPMDQHSAQEFRDICAEARSGANPRLTWTFAPYFESKLCERSWDPSWTMTAEEIRLLEKFGPPDERYFDTPGIPYLTKRNLAFRREQFATVRLYRQYPERFQVYYPTDPLSCWFVQGGSAIPSNALARHQQGILVPWDEDKDYQEYLKPKEGAKYVIGVDPAGYGGGDQAAFVVLEVWRNTWRQVAGFSSNTVNPPELSRILIRTAKRYNNALIIVENNGVGLGTLAILTEVEEQQGWDCGFELYYAKRGLGAKPGIAASKSSINKAMKDLIDGLMDELILYDAELVEQLSSYRQDKLVQQSQESAILRPGVTPRGRRAKHHWDRCSALMWACVAARYIGVGVDEPGTMRVDKPRTQEYAKTVHERIEKRFSKARPRTKKERRKQVLEHRKAVRPKPRPHWTNRSK